MERLIILLTVLLLASGCTTMGNEEKTNYDKEEKKESTVKRKVPANLMAIEALGTLMDKCPKEKQTEAVFKPAALLTTCNDASAKEMAQVTCHQTNQLIAMSNAFGALTFQVAKQNEKVKPTCATAVVSIGKEYFKMNIAKYKEYGAFGRTAFKWTSGAFIAKWAAESLVGLAGSGGDTVSTGDIMITKSDSSSAGEGGSTGRIGGQSVVFGSGKSASDQGLVFDSADKLINAPNPESSFDGPGTNIDDRNDGSNNDARFW